VRLQERAHEVRAVVSKIVEEYLAQIAAAVAVAKQQLANFKADRGSVQITSFRIARPQTLRDETLGNSCGVGPARGGADPDRR
jgi:hypothetical protein